VFPPVHENESDAERDLSEKNGKRESRKQVAYEKGKYICAGHKQACAGRMP
jgi:hypothetical protein